MHAASSLSSSSAFSPVAVHAPGNKLTSPLSTSTGTQLGMSTIEALSMKKPFRVPNFKKAGKKAEEKTYDEQPKRRIRANVKETGFDSMKYYMKTMGNHELLKKNEEIILAREIQVLIKWEETREELEAKLMRYVFRMHPVCIKSNVTSRHVNQSIIIV